LDNQNGDERPTNKNLKVASRQVQEPGGKTVGLLLVESRKRPVLHSGCHSVLLLDQGIKLGTDKIQEEVLMLLIKLVLYCDYSILKEGMAADSEQ
jgi:hypothetical protein